MKLFVYGTLQRSSSSPLNEVLANLGCTYERDAVVQGLVLYDLGSFPAAVRGTGSVEGEVWAMPEDPAKRKYAAWYLDRVEGHPHLYKRTKVDGDLTTYLFQQPVEGRPRVEGRWVRGAYDR